MSCRLHHVRFFEPNARAAHCIALHPSGESLALSRNDASIEIWDLRATPMISKVIPGLPTGSIEAMCWVNDRLLSTGLSGAIIEWDLKKLTVKNSVLITGHAGWCIDVTKQFTKIAVGTEQGYVNIFSVKNNTMEYERIFDKQEGRILCCKFAPSGEFLVTGSIETLRIWDVNSGQALHRMTTGRSEKKKETIVWCLEVTKDLTIISGDSRGYLTFWDGRIGQQIEAINTHKADILSICLSEDQKTIYCAGVDPLIISYKIIEMKHKGDNMLVKKWVKNIQRNIHQHDVRTMVAVGNKLFSGGVDGYLAMSSFPPKVLVKYPPLQSNTLTKFIAGTKYICLKYMNYIELWELGSALSEKSAGSYFLNSSEEPTNEDDFSKINGEKETYHGEIVDTSLGRRLKLKENPKLILKLSASSNMPIICYDISNSGRWIAYSTETQLRILKFSLIEGSATLSRLVPLPEECVPCHHMSFSPDSENLITGSPDACIKVFHIHTDGAVTLSQNIDTTEVLKDGTLIHMIVSETRKGGFYIAAADAISNIGVWRIKQSNRAKIELVAQLPQYKYLPSALTINKVEDTLIVAYTNQKLIEYSLKTMDYTEWSSSISSKKSLGTLWWRRMFPIIGLKVHPEHSHIIMAQDDCGIYVFNKNIEVEEEIEPKRSKKEGLIKENKLKYTTKKYKHLVGAGWVYNEDSEVEAAVVIVEPTTLIEKLPPAFFKHKFGCK